MMNNKLSCDIILDLLPSYVDGLTRENTNKAVEEHFKTCQSCKQSYDNMKQPEVVTSTFEEKKEIDFLKKTKRKHVAIIVAAILYAIFFGIFLFFTNAFFGNPISHLMAKHATERYVEDNYSELDVYIEEVNFDFKFSRYYAVVQSESSIDTNFAVYVSMTGEIEGDSYNNVLDGWNTYQRIEEEYRKLVDDALADFDLLSDGGFAFGSLKIDEKEVNGYAPIQYGINLSELELDKIYDVGQLGEEAGQIIFYAEDEEVTVEKAAEYILYIKQELDAAGVSFYTIDFSLEEKREEEEEFNPDAPVIYVSHFLYDDIYEEGMTERVQKAYEDLDAYYNKMDSKY